MDTSACTFEEMVVYQGAYDSILKDSDQTQEYNPLRAHLAGVAAVRRLRTSP